MSQPVIQIFRDGKANPGLQRYLKQKGFEVVVSVSLEEGLNLFQKVRSDIAIIDYYGPPAGKSLKVAKLLQQQRQTTPVILIVRESSEAKAIAALRVGVSDYFKRPYSHEEMLESIRRHLKRSPRNASNGKPEESGADLTFIGESPNINKIKEYIVRVAATDCNVLITGETGTGKEKVAELIHWHSSRRERPMICLNCAALPENLLESELFGYENGAFTGAFCSYPGKLRLAEGGTFFMDEIFEMVPHMQAKILRVIDTRKIYSLGGRTSIPLNIRIVAATNQDPENSMEQGTLRKDLFYRLNVARIHVPPLRERQTDIPLLLQYFLREMNRRYGRRVEGFADETLEVLLGYAWPGNIRELKSLVEALFINLPSRRVAYLGLSDFPESFQRLRMNLGLPQGEREQLVKTLLVTKWNISQAAEKLHISRKTLYKKLEKYEIQVSKGNRMLPPGNSTALLP
jgi:DNA-binding NtrC family response regulator